jgi:prevent-host-death family protein
MTRKIPAAEAKARLSELIARVAHGGERIIISRHGKPLAALVSVADVETLERPDGEDDDPWMRLGVASGDVPDEAIDRIVAMVYAERERNAAPPPDLRAD